MSLQSRASYVSKALLCSPERAKALVIGLGSRSKCFTIASGRCLKKADLYLLGGANSRGNRGPRPCDTCGVTYFVATEGVWPRNCPWCSGEDAFMLQAIRLQKLDDALAATRLLMTDAHREAYSLQHEAGVEESYYGHYDGADYAWWDRAVAGLYKKANQTAHEILTGLALDLGQPLPMDASVPGDEIVRIMEELWDGFEPQDDLAKSLSHIVASRLAQTSTR